MLIDPLCLTAPARARALSRCTLPRHGGAGLQASLGPACCYLDQCGALLLAETATVLLAGGAVEREAKKHFSISLQVGKTSAAFSNHASTACPTACRTAVGPAGGVVARLWLKMLQRS